MPSLTSNLYANRVLIGRNALIAGASSGIGAHIAGVFAHAGANVVLGSRRLEKTQEIVDKLESEGLAALAVQMDVTDEESVIAAYDAGEKRFGTIDTIVANAGTQAAGRATNVKVHRIKQLLDTNFLGVYLTACEGAKRLIASGSRKYENGRIIIIGSITAHYAPGGDAAYAATKAGIAHLARNFAREWVRQGINVNTVSPGFIDTEINGDWYETEAGKAHIAEFHRKRLLDIDALNDIMLFLASNSSKSVTGTEIIIDDGQRL